MASKGVMDWLLEADQPSPRSRTLTNLLGRAQKDPEVHEARRRIPEVGFPSKMLTLRALVVLDRVDR